MPTRPRRRAPAPSASASIACSAPACAPSAPSSACLCDPCVRQASSRSMSGVISVISLRFDGFVEKVEDVTTGSHVKAGEPLMTIYAPDLLKIGGRLVVEGETGWGPGAAASRTTLNERSRRSSVVGARRLLATWEPPTTTSMQSCAPMSRPCPSSGVRRAMASCSSEPRSRACARRRAKSCSELRITP